MIKQLIDRIIDFNDPEMFNFQTGYLAGLSVALAIIMIFLFVKIFFMIFFHHPRRAKGITIPDEKGDIFVSSRAILSMISSLEGNFPSVSFEKIKIFHGRKGYIVIINMVLSASGMGLPELNRQIKERVFSKFKESLGITSVEEVRINVSDTASN
ncbi:MAG: hypothetical protein A2020_08875 [Lentisphaerae bacterium GWF2_45_14]|nr:MAG: hypothetical protein A2020_08875 [Lentisphaerae bacterium GWF2_45_14]